MASKPEPTDMHAYYDHLPTFEAVEEANARTVFNQRVMLGLTAVQVFCACGFLGLEDTTPNTTGQTLLLVASATVLLSGVLGFFGTWKLYKCVACPTSHPAHTWQRPRAPTVLRGRGLLNWFFISQLWCLSVVITLLLRGQLTDANETILCSQSRCHAAAHRAVRPSQGATGAPRLTSRAAAAAGSVGYAGCSAISGGWIVFFSVRPRPRLRPRPLSPPRASWRSGPKPCTWGAPIPSSSPQKIMKARCCPSALG